MGTWGWILLWIVVAILILVALSFWGKKLQKKYEEQQSMINQHKQTMQIFVIDKKKDTLENVKFPKGVKDQIPKSQKKKKMPIVLAKVGPSVQPFICDEAIFNSMPVKKNVKVELAGILIVGIVSGKLPTPEKMGFRQRMLLRANKMRSKTLEASEKNK